MPKVKQFLFDVQLNWQHGTKAILSSYGVEGTLKVFTPQAFGGPAEKSWSPEHLLLCSVTSCFMSTFLYYAGCRHVTISSLECETVGEVKLTDGKMEYTAINVYAVAKVEGDEWLPAAKEILLMAENNCIITKALRANVYYHNVAMLNEGVEMKRAAANKSLMNY